MKQFLDDLVALLKKHWLTIATIIVAVWLISNYSEIKSGIIDAWGGA